VKRGGGKEKGGGKGDQENEVGAEGEGRKKKLCLSTTGKRGEEDSCLNRKSSREG